ncbi:MAG: hypothetical protein QOE93_2094 [Actinomycetota bacterium]|jgi:hypothetical protein|nr:hypothetical protein [Actinomycetota bacterium]
MAIEERFAALAREFAAFPDVDVPDASSPRTFGSGALKVNGSIFAMVSGDHLVLKLPRDRVAALIGKGTGAPFDGGTDRPMKEWLTVIADEGTWVALAHEALDFVRSKSRGG